MYVFLYNQQPLSSQVKNKKHKEIYKQGIEKAFKKYNIGATLLDGDLHGIVYYFHRVATTLDVDNMSKPIWDALNTIAYPDDRNIKLRIAGVFDLNSNPIGIIDILQMPDSVLDDFSQVTDENAKEQHVIYVEVGILNYDLFRFGCEV
jgi:Holliday junction resolvase RusA-like endonuclease